MVFVEREVNTHVTLTFRIINRSSGGRDPTSLTFATGIIFITEGELATQ